MLRIVSNRLPVTYQRTKSGYSLASSAGGLAVGLDALRGRGEVTWVGWPGNVSPGHRAEVSRRLSRESQYEPVFLPDRLVRSYYNGFCNRTVWPLFHSFPAYARYNASEWKAYREANELFADRLLSTASPDDTFWIHDYHLMLLPKLLRERLPRAKIGFFLHIPFPHYETLRMLPQHKEVLQGLLGADLVGFHTYDYAQSYLGSVRRLLGLDSSLGQIAVGGRAVQVDVFPMGIDFKRFARAAHEPEVKRHTRRIRARFRDVRLVLSISRLDYTKGILNQLAAIETFLAKHPNWRRRFVHLLVVVPSREGVGRYSDLRREIDELVGRINGRHGTLDWQPILYIYRYLPFEELAALYSSADVALVTPVRDGMNLIAKEYLAAREDGRGALVLSEMAGAARELVEALVVNPNSKEEIAEALLAALEMPHAERQRRSEVMRARLRAYDIETWRRSFLSRLEEAAAISIRLAARRLSVSDRKVMLEAYLVARRRLILLDYDGTLVPFAADPAAVAPDARLLDLLSRLAAVAGNDVVVVSGRDHATLERWLGRAPVTLVAEHGVWVRWRGAPEWELVVRSQTAWKPQVRAVMGLFTGRIPGSFVEEKDYSLVWHYRNADLHLGTEAAKELVDALTALTANTDVVVMTGQRVVEVKPAAAGKGSFFLGRLSSRAFDFIFAAGDDATDETLFRVLPEDAFSLRVGLAASSARFNAEAVRDVIELLEDLSRACLMARENLLEPSTQGA